MIRSKTALSVLGMARMHKGSVRATAVVMAETSSKPAEGLSLSRWSRLKREQAAAATQIVEPKAAPAAAVAPNELAKESTQIPPQGDSAHPQLALPEISSISLTEDFTPFMQAKVPQLVKQQALKALFKSPHFNVMDGLDTYIDDYTVFEPISAEDMGKLSAWQSIQNPLQQVVTPGGYAVDVKSEEGIAVLAERDRVAALSTDGTETPSFPAEEPALDSTVADTAKPAASSHPRYGKRVGDFNARAESVDETTAPEDAQAPPNDDPLIVDQPFVIASTPTPDALPQLAKTTP
ncbi:MAG: DUF3306 domain-containing protein [Betaproteobacteria bacterium]|nr:MAG: DUF3306 domain-containing protein [Betaproteobacteria bacterium]